MRKEQLIFHDDSSVFGQIEKSKDIYIKFKKTEIYNNKRIQPSNNKFITAILGGTLRWYA